MIDNQAQANYCTGLNVNMAWQQWSFGAAAGHGNASYERGIRKGVRVFHAHALLFRRLWLCISILHGGYWLAGDSGVK